MPKIILLIDDEKDTVNIMKKRIQNAGYDAYVAYNGKEGLEAASQLHPHLILTDVAMPVMDGFDFYNELKKRPDLAHIPVIVASAHGTTEEQFRVLGVKDFLTKPFNTDVLVHRVGSYFQAQKALKVLIATKMFYLMKTIMEETKEFSSKLEIQLTKDTQTIVADALKFNPDLILLDVDLFIEPKASDVVAALRAQEPLKETHILLNRSMLGDDVSQCSNDTIKECLTKGASHFVGSLNKDAFLFIIQDYCR